MSAWDDPVAHIRGLERRLAAVEAALGGAFYIPSEYAEDALVYAEHIRAALETP